MGKSVLVVMMFTMISKAFGFIREITLAYFFGASNISDVYLISTMIPNIIFGFIFIGLSAGYIPMYSQIKSEFGMEKADLFTSNVINILLLICSIVVVIGIVFTKPIVNIFASGFDGAILKLTIEFTRISIFSIYFLAISSMFSNYLYLKNNYIIPKLTGLPYNILIIIFIILGYKWNLKLLAIGFVLATFVKLLIFIPYLKKYEYKYRFIINFKDRHFKKMLYIIVPVILGSSVNQINLIIDRTIATNIKIGGVSALNYANSLVSLVQGVFVVSITTVLFPALSKKAISNDLVGIKESITTAITAVNFFLVPINVGIIIFSREIITLLFGRGEFDFNSIEMTAIVLFFYSFGLLGYGLREIFSKVFYSMQDTKPPMINAVIGMVLNIILNIILSQYLGISGLALATSVSASITLVLMFISFQKKVGSIKIKKISISFLKILLSSLIMGIIAKKSYLFFIDFLTPNFSTIIAILIGAFSYFVIVILTRIEEIDSALLDIYIKFKNWIT